ncbi:MAG: hypothetical protein ACXWQQ_11510 [Pseudobdellovibrio sp.]
MRTLTQVWVFLISLTFIFLLVGFQLLGRVGLFIAFLLSLGFLYAALRNSLRLFRGALQTKAFTGNDPTGFLSEIEKNKSNFGFKKVDIYATTHPTPPLVWKNTDDTGYIIINDRLLDQLNTREIRLLSIFLLSHLENRSFVVVHILSILKIPIVFLSLISSAFSAFANRLFKTQLELTTSDIKFITMSEVSKFEAGYFIHKLHKINLNHLKKNNPFHFFSTLSIDSQLLFNEYGIPDLKSRLKKMMGFSL